MLFGGNKVNDNVVNWFLQNKEINDDCGSKILFAACANSFPQGISRYNSDYDLHIVKYSLNRDLKFEKEICRTEKHSCHTGVIDFGNSSPHIELIQWLDVDLFSALVQPREESRRISSTIYYILYASLYTQYTYDPFGLIPYILSECSSVCDLGIIADYLWKRALVRTNGNEEVSLKNYMSRLHCYLSIIWIEKNNSFPPIDVKMLLNQYINNRECPNVYGFYLDNRNKNCIVKGNDLIRFINELSNVAEDSYNKLLNRAWKVPVEKQIEVYRKVVGLCDIAAKKCPK